MIKNLKKCSTYYAPATCDICGSLSDYGQLIAVNIPEIIFTSFTSYKAFKHFKFVCPKCYIEGTKEDRASVPTCLSDPERRAELLERYKEV